MQAEELRLVESEFEDVDCVSSLGHLGTNSVMLVKYGELHFHVT